MKLTDEQLNEMEADASFTTDRPPNYSHVCRAIAELRELRALLATPCETEVWHYSTRNGPRVAFECGREDVVTSAGRALALGAALIRAALAARDGKP